MRPLTDPDSTSKIMGFTKLRVYQAATKAMNLGWSLFHPKAEFLVASGSIGPVEAIKALAQMDRTGEIFLQGEREMSFEGGVPLGEAGGQRTFEAYRSLKPGAIPTQADIWKTKKGVRDAVKAADAITHFTFDTTAGRWKVYDYLVRKAAYLAKNPTSTPGQLHAEMRRNTEYLNNAYGGIHWENRGWNRQTVNVMRAIIMAPDWVFSNVFTVKSAMMDWRKGTGASSRMFIARSAANGIAATVVTSILLNGPAKYYQVIDEDKKNIRRALTEVYTGDDKDGRHIWRQIYFGGAMSDIAQVVNKAADDGPVGILEYARNKTRTSLEASNRTGSERELSSPGDLRPGGKLARQSSEAGSLHYRRFSPCPLLGTDRQGHAFWPRLGKVQSSRDFRHDAVCFRSASYCAADR